MNDAALPARRHRRTLLDLRHRRTLLAAAALACAATAATTIASAASTASPAGADGRPRALAAQQVGNSASLTVVPGVRIWTQGWRTPGGSYERSSLMSVDLTKKNVSLDTASAHGVMNSGYLPVRQMILGSGAVAGINGDFFNLGTSTGVTYGGIVHAGSIWKTPPRGLRANLYVRANRTAGIGPIDYTGTVKVTSKVHYALHSVNTVKDAANGFITEITSHLDGTSLPANCAVAVAKRGSGSSVRIVRLVKKTPSRFRLAELPSSQVAFAGCYNAATWIGAALRVGTRAQASGGFTSGRLYSLVSGAEVLLHNGQDVYDNTGHGIRGHNAETFACVSKDAKHLLLGTVDDIGGWWGGGVTMAQLRAYLSTQGCYNAMALDGGGSSTLDYRYPGSSTVTTVNSPADGAERWIPDSFLVYSR